MIRYNHIRDNHVDSQPLTEANLRLRIEDEKPGWLARAKSQTQENALSDTPAFPSLWSEIKGVYIQIQCSKCAFCEQTLEGRISQDVEHFRPKGKVSAWAPSQILIDAGLVLNQPADEVGYKHLAYHPLNYAMSCKVCNTVFKGNLFPILKTRKVEAKKPPSIETEKPLLVYPIGDTDDDPEQIIAFSGWTPQAKSGNGFDRMRALSMIELFGLNDWEQRKELLVGRARQIQLLYLNLAAIDENSNPVVVRAAKANARRMLLDSEPHSNCLRSFVRLYREDPAQAQAFFAEVSEYLQTISN